MKLLWNDEEYSEIQKDLENSQAILNLLRITLLGKKEYENLFLYYEKVLNNWQAKDFLQNHDKEENYKYLIENWRF